jgi:hypothetical protein
MDTGYFLSLIVSCSKNLPKISGMINGVGREKQAVIPGEA